MSFYTVWTARDQHWDNSGGGRYPAPYTGYRKIQVLEFTRPLSSVPMADGTQRALHGLSEKLCTRIHMASEQCANGWRYLAPYTRYRKIQVLQFTWPLNSFEMWSFFHIFLRCCWVAVNTIIMIFYLIFTVMCRKTDFAASVSSPVSLTPAIIHNVANISENFRTNSKWPQ